MLGWSLLSLLGEAGAGACHSSSSGGSGWQLSSEKESKIIIKSVHIGVNVLRLGVAVIVGQGWGHRHWASGHHPSSGEAGAGSGCHCHQEMLGLGGPLSSLSSSGKTRVEKRKKKKIERQKSIPASAGVLASIQCGWASSSSGKAGNGGGHSRCRWGCISGLLH